MKSPVVFRAEFSGPKGALNPSGWRIPGTVGVEVYQASGTEWRARRPGTKIDFPITPQGSLATLKQQIEGKIWFERRATPWEAFDLDFKEILQDDEWAIDPKGKVYITEVRRKRLTDRSIKKANEEGLQRAETEKGLL